MVGGVGAGRGPSRRAGLAHAPPRHPPPADAGDAIALLSAVLETEQPPTHIDDVDRDAETEGLIARRGELRNELRDINDKLRGLDEFARVGTEYSAELNEHRVRLASIGLIPEATDAEATCPVCQTILTETGAHDAIGQTLGRVARRIELAQRDQPRITQTRADFLQARTQVRAGLADINTSLEELARTDDLRARAQRTWDQQSYVRGRIAQFLDTTTVASDDTIAGLERIVEALEDKAAKLTEELDPEALRSAMNSLLNIVGRRMTELAQALPLEHSEHGVRIDPYRLTIVADTLQGPAYMDAGAIGSGMSWVGYHLTAYLALQGYFIDANRPVPRFIVLDQPSQAFFPRDRERGGDLSEMSDTDRDNTRKLYRMMYDVVTQLDGELQIIAFDHADFADDWFQDSIIETWRDGNALIPREWYATEPESQAALPAARAEAASPQDGA